MTESLHAKSVDALRPLYDELYESYGGIYDRMTTDQTDIIDTLERAMYVPKPENAYDIKRQKAADVLENIFDKTFDSRFHGLNGVGSLKIEGLDELTALMSSVYTAIDALREPYCREKYTENEKKNRIRPDRIDTGCGFDSVRK